MFSMKPGNSSFFSFSRLNAKNGSALLLFDPTPRPFVHQTIWSGLRAPDARARCGCSRLFQDGPRHRDEPLFVQHSTLRAGQGSGVERIRI